MTTALQTTDRADDRLGRMHAEYVGKVNALVAADREELAHELAEDYRHECAGRDDPVLVGVPEEFDAFVGHKEACSQLPPNAVLLASSATCPVQMFRIKRNLYATQFHPELDVDGIVTRVRVYQHAGYFAPAEMEDVIVRLAPAVVTEPGRMLANFVARYG